MISKYNIKTEKGILLAKLRNHDNDSYLITNKLSNIELQKCYDFKDGSYEPRFGYLPPKRIVSYFDKSHKKEIKESPTCKIEIRFQDEWEDPIYDAGTQVFLSKFKNHLILNNYLLPQDVLEKRIDSEFVEVDNSGLIIPITKEIVLQELNRLKENLTINFMGPKYEDFSKVEKLANVGDIDISSELKSAREYANNKVIEYFSSPKILEKILDDTEEAILRNLSPSDIILGEEGTFCDFSRLYEIITNLKFPNKKLFQKTFYLLNMLINSCDKHVDSINKTIEEYAKEQGEIRDKILGYQYDIKNKIKELKSN